MRKFLKQTDKFLDKASNIIIGIIIFLGLLYFAVSGRIEYDKAIVKEAITEINNEK